MENKEIYIDGVDVAGCEFAVKPINDNRIKCHCVKGLLQIAKMHEQPESVKSGLCENNPNCYYKQLKRLEQENKELKIVKEQLKKWNDENLKRQDDMQLWIDLAEEQRKKYRSALEEILSFCTKDFVTDEELKKQLNNKWLPKFAKGSATERNRRKYIINKINEVLNDK